VRRDGREWRGEGSGEGMGGVRRGQEE